MHTPFITGRVVCLFASIAVSGLIFGSQAGLAGHYARQADAGPGAQPLPAPVLRLAAAATAPPRR